MSGTKESLKGSLNRQEQHSTKNCLLIHSLPEWRNKNTHALVIDTVKEKMGEEIKKDGTNESHRLGALKNNGKSRPIIIKFARYNIRSKVFKIEEKK